MFSPEILKKRRTELKISQIDIARKLGITRQSYFYWENGKTRPNGKNTEKLAEILGVSPTYFESEYKIVETYLHLNSANREKVEEYAEELLSIQEESKVVQFYSIKVIGPPSYRLPCTGHRSSCRPPDRPCRRSV